MSRSERSLTERKDVVVIGGGPAGSAAACALARAGLDVALLERTHFEGHRVGELVSPEVTASLQWMDVWKQFEEGSPLRVRGLVSSWGTATPQLNDFLANPFGQGWLVDRRRFDRLLFEAAAAAGAHTFTDAAARRCWRDGDWWTVETAVGGHQIVVQSRYIVDATGRTRGARRGARRRIDRLVACVCYIDGQTGSSAAPSHAVLEAVKDGWWFAAPLPEGRLVVMFLTDADLLPQSSAQLIPYFWRCVEQTELTREQLPSAAVRHRFYRCAADSQWRPPTDANRIAVGDALLSMDPLCGRGVEAAVDSGRLAAAAIVAREQGDQAALARCATAHGRRLSSYITERVGQYRLEQRWATSPFWARRLGTQAGQGVRTEANKHIL